MLSTVGRYFIVRIDKRVIQILKAAAVCEVLALC